MPFPYSPTAQYDIVTAPDIPDGPVFSAPQWKKVLDARVFSASAATGVLQWSGALSVDPGGTNSVFAVNVGAIGAVVIQTASAYVVRSGLAATLDATKISGGGNLANSTWYYVYCYDNAGVLDYEISPTAPAASLRIKSGDLTRRYLGCFPTLSTGAPVALRASNGAYRYRRSAQAVADLRVLLDGAVVGPSAVACAALVPPHSSLATIRAVLQSGTNTVETGLLRTNGDSGLGEFTLYTPPVTNALATAAVDVETDASQQIAYGVSVVTAKLTLFVDGFYE